ncbi:MAG: TIGR04086 family membrane protein [Porcipelethomonas sp.]
MSRKKSIRSRKYYSFAVSMISGVMISSIVFFLCSFAISIADIPYGITVFMGSVVVASGGFAAGRSLGKRKRRGGIKCGVICACALTAAFIALSFFLTGKIHVPGVLKKSVLLLVCSVAGGISGVNTKIKRPPV